MGILFGRFHHISSTFAGVERKFPVHMKLNFFFTPVPTWARHCFGVQARLDSTILYGYKNGT